MSLFEHSDDAPASDFLTENLYSYPKHVWSPAGGWYAQPANWKRNTVIASVCMWVIVGFTWKLSAEIEERHKMPEPGRFYPSR